jgi:L-threonylcarbamoyladenylate synthase
MKKIDIIHKAVSKLKAGEVIALPTETVYGLAVDATNLAAISKLYTLKQRSFNKPLVIAVAHAQDVVPWVSAVSSDARLLMDAFWPGPLTIILPRGKAVSDLITAGKSSIGLRYSSCVMLQDILHQLGHAICLTSANQSGTEEAMSAEKVRSEFPNELFIVEEDTIISGTPSTIIDMAVMPYRILREGEITLQQIQDVLGSNP